MTDVTEFLEENREKEIFPKSITEKYTLTVREACAYVNVGVGRMRELIAQNQDTFGVIAGNRYLVIREKLEEYIRDNHEL